MVAFTTRLPILSAQEKEVKRSARWYFGGLACMTAACCTHPLDMMKVHLQTHSDGKLHILKSMFNVAKHHGIRRLYSGLTASVTREAIYSGTRFGIYELLKPNPGSPAAPFYIKVSTAAFAGSVGAFIATPFDLINVRMLTDVKRPCSEKRHYRHVLHGFIQILKEEGPSSRLFNGATLVVLRGVCITVGQLSFYDQVKQTLLSFPYFDDTIGTHLCSSCVAACTAATLAMPVDVMKTRVQNSRPGQYKASISVKVKIKLPSPNFPLFQSIYHCAKEISRNGPSSFYKGFIPALIRIGCHTIISFLTFEQLRIHFGVKPCC